MLVSQAEFARMEGVAKSYITELKKAGRLVMVGDEVDVEASRTRIDATADPGKAGVVERHAKTRGEHASAVNGENIEKEEDEVEGPASPPDYQAARARKEMANAQLAELEVAQKSGELFLAKEVIALIADAATIFRATLDARRPLLVAQLAVQTDESEIRLFLEEQDEHLLSDLHSRFDTLGKSSS